MRIYSYLINLIKSESFAFVLEFVPCVLWGFFLGGEVESGAESQTGDGQVLAGHHRGDRAAEQGRPGQRDGGVLHLLPEGWCSPLLRQDIMNEYNRLIIILPSGGYNDEMSLLGVLYSW